MCGMQLSCIVLWVIENVLEIIVCEVIIVVVVVSVIIGYSSVCGIR